MEDGRGCGLAEGSGGLNNNERSLVILGNKKGRISPAKFYHFYFPGSLKPCLWFALSIFDISNYPVKMFSRLDSQDIFRYPIITSFFKSCD